MSFFVGGLTGVTFIETQPLSRRDYDPVVGSYREMDPRDFLQILPDHYPLLADYDMLPEVWRGYMQVVADLYLSTLCADSASTLDEVPLDYQRKYAHFDLDRQHEFLYDPGLSYLGREAFSVQPAEGVLRASLRSRLGLDAAYFPLTSRLDERARLRWGWRAVYESWEPGGYSFVGYFDSARGDIISSLLVGVSEGRVVVANFSEIGGLNTVSSTAVIPLGARVEIQVGYDSERVDVTVRDLDTDTVLLDSLSYLLENGPAVRDFEANAFGVVNLDHRSADAGTLSSARGKLQVVAIESLSYLDPTLADTVQDVPFLQDQWDNNTFFWTRSEDFEIQSPSSGSFFAFEEEPPAFVLAEYVSHNLELVRLNFGEDVGLPGPNTEAYQNQVTALHYALWKGPTLASIRLGVQVLLGLPFTVEAGTVRSLNPLLSGSEGEIVVEGPSGLRGYRYPLSVTPLVLVGDSVEAFQPLTDGVQVRDWRSDPDWFVPLLGDALPALTPSVFGAALGISPDHPVPVNELQKFHTFAVAVPAELLDLDLYIQVSEFVETLKQTWKTFLLLTQQSLVDDTDIEDPLVVYLTVRFSEYGGGGSDLTAPVYGAPGDPPYTYAYGQSSPPLRYGMVLDLFPDDPVQLTLTNMAGGDRTIIVNGTPVTVPSAGTVIEAVA